VVLTQDEIRRLFAGLSGQHRICAELMYGSGLRVMEVCRLRVKDVDLERLAILVRDGKGCPQPYPTFREVGFDVYRFTVYTYSIK
jgi:integrase